MHRVYVSIIAAGFMCLMACKEDTPLGISQIPSVSEVRMTDKWKPNISNLYKIEVITNDPQGLADVKTVLLQVRREPDTGTIFQDSLFDDGAYLHPNDGDVFAGDGVFTNRFSTEIIDPGTSRGNYVFSFVAIDQGGNKSGTIERAILFSDNAAPVIRQISSPDTFNVALQDLLLMVTITDTNGQNDVQRVYFESRNPATGVQKYEGDLFDDGDWENSGDVKAGDSVFTARMDTGIAVGKLGHFELLFKAEDKFGETSATESAMIYIENLVPEFGDIDVPESLNRPAPGSPEIRRLITVQVLNPEGLADVDSVYFYSRKPDSTLANNGLPFILRDNGLPFDPNDQNNPPVAVGDNRASDGIYSFSLILYPSADLGTYRFSFYIRDKAGNLSPALTRDLDILPFE